MRHCKSVVLAGMVCMIGGMVFGQTAARSDAVSLDTREKKGLEIAVCAYSFRKLTTFEAIEKIKECGGEAIEFFLWQKLSPEFPDVTLSQDMSDAHIAKLKAKLQAWGVRPVNAYFSNANLGKTEEDARKLFVFAKKLGLRGLTGEPPVAQLDMLEKLVKEYDIQLCFHNHAKNPKKPDYRNWDPDYLMGLMKDRDPRMVFSVDTGHIYRSAMDPIEYLKTVEGRVMAVHLQDVRECKYGSPDVVYGKGAGDIPAVLAELKRQKFIGHVGVEFDDVSGTVEQDVKACLEIIRAQF